MNDRSSAAPDDPHNPYASPREQGYLTPEYQAWRAWLRDRAMLFGCGLVAFVLMNAALWACYGAWWLITTAIQQWWQQELSV